MQGNEVLSGDSFARLVIVNFCRSLQRSEPSQRTSLIFQSGERRNLAHPNGSETPASILRGDPQRLVQARKVMVHG